MQVLTWNCVMLGRRHLAAAISSTLIMWIEDARALWRAPMSVSSKEKRMSVSPFTLLVRQESDTVNP